MASHKNLVLMALFVLAVMRSTEAQSQMPSCATKLITCATFISNSTIKPDKNCCDSIKDAVEHDLPCLCNLYNSPGGLSSFGITTDDALRVSRDCNVNTDLTACNSTAAAPTEITPPGVSGGDSGGAGRIVVTGITSLFLISASMMLY